MKLAAYLSQLARHGAVYGTADFLGKSLSFALVPFYTRTLSPLEFGQLQVLLTFQGFGVVILGFGQLGTLLRYFVAADDEAERRRVVAGVGTLITTATVIFLGGLVALGPVLARGVLHNGELASLFTILSIGLAARGLSDVAMTLLRLQEQSARYGIYNLCRLVLGLVLILYFVLVRGLGIQGAILGEAIASVALLVAQTPRLIRAWGGVPDGATLREYLSFGVPFVFANLGAVALQSIDKIFLATYEMVVAAGVYALAGKMAALISVMLLGPFTLVWGPMMYRVEREHPPAEAQRVFARLLTYFALLLYLVAIGIIVFSREIIHLVAGGGEYADAQPLVPFLVTAAVLYGLYRHLQVGLNITRNTKVLAGSFVLAALLNIVGNALLIPPWGALGAAVATLLSYVLMVVLVARAAHRVYPIPYEWGRISIAAGVATTICLLTPWLDTFDLVPRLAAKALAVLAFPLGIGLGGFLRPGERTYLRERWAALRARAR